MTIPTDYEEIQILRSGAETLASDRVAVEAPLSIHLRYNLGAEWINHPLTLAMRTPGADEELAAGLLYCEGVIEAAGAIDSVKKVDAYTIEVSLKLGVAPRLETTQRFSLSSSSCGVCGKSSLAQMVTHPRAPLNDGLRVTDLILSNLPRQLREQQGLFSLTGGVHASALFDPAGKLQLLREDVGRHNALDKIIGHHVLANTVPIQDRVLLVSGRVSYDLVQKAVAAGIQILAAIGAPSNLAVHLAQENNLTLIGFLQKDRYNLYCHEQRIIPSN